jgi:hypothetical protein
MGRVTRAPSPHNPPLPLRVPRATGRPGETAPLKQLVRLLARQAAREHLRASDGETEASEQPRSSEVGADD